MGSVCGTLASPSPGRNRLPRIPGRDSPAPSDPGPGGISAGYPSARPARTAQAATSVRDAMPSLDSTFETWTAAVRGEM
jgi:hypothetical protein